MMEFQYVGSNTPEAVNLRLDKGGEKWDGFVPALSVAVSGPGENLRENPGLTRAPP